MGRQITDLTELLEVFDTFASSMYRLETLQAYDVEYEKARYEAFLAGRTVDMAPGTWQTMIQRHRAHGRAVERVHVIFEPLSNYLRYELATTYQRNTAAGEWVGIVQAEPGQWPSDLPTEDYWLFDDHTLWTMSYDRHGQFVMAENITDSDTIRTAVTGKYAALAAATPLATYLMAHPISTGRAF